MSAYQEHYQWAQEQPEQFWQQQAQNIDWFHAPQAMVKVIPSPPRLMIPPVFVK